LLALFAVSTVSEKNGFPGPYIGTKIATSNPRNFSEEVLQQKDAIIGQQMCSYKGASQHGMNIGKLRNIID
jgi:hypothetical protein